MSLVEVTTVSWYVFLRKTNDLSDLAHHEHWDGSGYPAGLVGNAIPISARIVAIVNAFDGLTTAHAYERARSPFEALALMGNELSGRFDIDLLRRFVPVWGPGGRGRRLGGRPQRDHGALPGGRIGRIDHALHLQPAATRQEVRAAPFDGPDEVLDQGQVVEFARRQAEGLGATA